MCNKRKDSEDSRKWSEVMRETSEQMAFSDALISLNNIGLKQKLETIALEHFFLLKAAS